MHVETSRLSRLRAFELSPDGFRRLASLAIFALWLIVSTGAVVRLTSSGLGCEHWPGCEPGRPSRPGAEARGLGIVGACFALIASGTLSRRGRTRAASTSIGSGRSTRRSCCTARSSPCSAAA